MIAVMQAVVIAVTVPTVITVQAIVIAEAVIITIVYTVITVHADRGDQCAPRSVYGPRWE